MSTTFNFGWNTQVCTGDLICLQCGRIHGKCNFDESKFNQENDNMLPRHESNTDDSKTGKGRQQQSGIPYLTNQMMTVEQRKAKIMAVRIDLDGKFGPQVTLKITYAGALYLWRLKLNNPSYAALLEKIGPDENAWPGTEFLLGLEQDEFTAQFWPKVTFPESSSGKKK
jgi:hypothetical protein